MNLTVQFLALKGEFCLQKFKISPDIIRFPKKILGNKIVIFCEFCFADVKPAGGEGRLALLVGLIDARRRQQSARLADGTEAPAQLPRAPAADRRLGLGENQHCDQELGPVAARGRGGGHVRGQNPQPLEGLPRPGRPHRQLLVRAAVGHARVQLPHAGRPRRRRLRRQEGPGRPVRTGQSQEASGRLFAGRRPACRLATGQAAQAQRVHGAQDALPILSRGQSHAKIIPF